MKIKDTHTKDYRTVTFKLTVDEDIALKSALVMAIKNNQKQIDEYVLNDSMTQYQDHVDYLVQERNLFRSILQDLQTHGYQHS